MEDSCENAEFSQNEYTSEYSLDNLNKIEELCQNILQNNKQVIYILL